MEFWARAPAHHHRKNPPGRPVIFFLSVKACSMVFPPGWPLSWGFSHEAYEVNTPINQLAHPVRLPENTSTLHGFSIKDPEEGCRPAMKSLQACLQIPAGLVQVPVQADQQSEQEPH